jgi:hypothetical protein
MPISVSFAYADLKFSAHLRRGPQKQLPFSRPVHGPRKGSPATFNKKNDFPLRCSASFSENACCRVTFLRNPTAPFATFHDAGPQTPVPASITTSS